jgi:hypothetical protein
MEDVVRQVGETLAGHCGPGIEGVRAIINLARAGAFGSEYQAALQCAWRAIADPGDVPVRASMTIDELRRASRDAGLSKSGTKSEVLQRLVMTVPRGVPPKLWSSTQKALRKERRDAAVQVAQMSLPAIHFSFDTHVSLTSLKRSPYNLPDFLIFYMPFLVKFMSFGGRRTYTRWFRITRAVDVALEYHGSRIPRVKKEALMVLRETAVSNER